jgi:hypothetical protein
LLQSLTVFSEVSTDEGGNSPLHGRMADTVRKIASAHLLLGDWKRSNPTTLSKIVSDQPCCRQSRRCAYERSLRPRNKPFPRVSQSVAGAGLAKETAVRLVFKRLNVARHRRVPRRAAWLQPRACPARDREEAVPILAWLPVSHRLLPLINAHQLGICSRSFDSKRPQILGQPTSAGLSAECHHFQWYFHARLLRARCRYEPEHRS